jgi:hypothetical protein
MQYNSIKKIQSFWLLSMLLFLALSESLHAVPAFAKQTGLECFMCHSNNQTNLNAIGRDFARSSYQMTKPDNSESLISGERVGLDIPTVLNMSVMLKARVDKGYDVINGKGIVVETSDDDKLESNRGLYEIFKTSTLNIGGKVANNVGALFELREKENKAILGGKVISSFKTGDAYSGFSIYTTNNYGLFSGMETYNTGLYKPLRQFENHKLTNAAQAADFGSGEATGAQVFYSGDILFATLGAYVPMHNSDGISIDGGAIPFARIALERRFGNLNLIVGAYGAKGSVKAKNTTFDSTLSGLVPSSEVKLTKEAYGLDLQLEGEMFSMESMLTMNAVLKNKTELDNPAIMNYLVGPTRDHVNGEPADSNMKAYSVSFEIYPLSSLGLKVAYLNLDDQGPYTYELDKVDAKDKSAYTLGFDYSLRQNVMFTMEYSLVQADRQDIKNYSDLLAVMTVSF